MTERARLESVRLVRERLGAIANGDPVVLVGAFNSKPSSETYERLVGDGPALALSDAKTRSTAGHHGPDHTFPGFSDPRTGRRIDHVFLSADVAVDHHTSCVELRADGRVASDHAPVVADVSTT